MIILESGFGNMNEAYIESRFKPKLNIIYSNDNNKGKTLVLQSLMFALGNDPIFPEGFNYREYHHYVKIEEKGEQWSFLRKGNSFIVLHSDQCQLLDSVADLKRYIRSAIFEIPIYVKDGATKITDLALFYQIFFLPQDCRDTSTVIGGGYFNKSDYLEMVYGLANESATYPLTDSELDELKNEIKATEDAITDQKKFLKFSRKRPEISAIANNKVERDLYEAKKIRLDQLHSSVSEMQKKRSRETSHKLKLEYLINELRSIKQNISEGKVECGDCHSQNIVYKTQEFNFEVSNDYVRNNILTSIRNEIALKNEIIDELNRGIEKEQSLIAKELENTSKPIQIAMFAFDEMLSDSNILKKLAELEAVLKEKKDLLNKTTNQQNEGKAKGKSLVDRLLIKMNELYKQIDPNGTQEFMALFSKRDAIYSGSERMEFYLSKLIALKVELKHNFPIIIDCFRDGELSTEKEAIALGLLKNIDPQVIISATLKEQEYSADVYKSPEINQIDFSTYPSSKILSSKAVGPFREILKSFSISTVPN